MPENPTACAWDGNTDDVRESHGEWLCKHCRAVVAFHAIIDAVEG